jgi:hypothetical protein
MSPSRLNQSRFHRRRAMLGVPLVLHLLWVAVIAGAPALGAQHAAMPAEHATMTDMTGMPHCHDAIAADTVPPPPIDEALASASHAPCCAEQCHCATALCVVLLPAHVPVSLTTVSASLPLCGETEPDRAQPDRNLRPPILT